MFDLRVIKIVEQRLQIGTVGLISFVWFELGYAGEIAGIEFGRWNKWKQQNKKSLFKLLYKIESFYYLGP